MATADHFWVITARFWVLLAVTLKFSVNVRGVASSLVDVVKPIVNKNSTVGLTVKISYKASTAEAVESSLRFGYWTWNRSIILPDDNLVIGNSTGNSRGKAKGKFWLKIKNVNISNSGLYSFVINGTVLRRWMLHVTKGVDRREVLPLRPCGGPLRKLVSHCVPFTESDHPGCKSFPGPPLNVEVRTDIRERKPVVQVKWEPPNTGRSDLWGYQVYLVGKDLHAGHIQCVQINNKSGNWYWIFRRIKYGATYQVFVQSMPALHGEVDKNEVSCEIKVSDECEIHGNSPQCCSLINITAEYIDKKIKLAWTMPLRKECREVNIFRIRWTNIQKPKCVGEDLIKDQFKYTIHLKKEGCSRFNYSIKLDGRGNKTYWSKASTVTLLIPPTVPGSQLSQVLKSVDNTPKILIAVFCSLLGIAICTSLVVYRIYFQQVRIKLPHPSTEFRPNSDQPLLNYDCGKKRVFILHTRCCDKCNHVVHCLGTVLSSTELIEPSIDMWNTLDISPNVPRWYEDQVKKSDCVLVLGSIKMSRRCQNSLEEGDDPLQIKCQLNFVRGNIAQNPDTHRFIPAFFTCNGSKKDIPDFLSDRWSHKLPKEVDRVIFRVLNVEKIQPHRFQPIVVMGGNGHPFDERKKELEKAVQEAETYHKNNSQI